MGIPTRKMEKLVHHLDGVFLPSEVALGSRFFRNLGGISKIEAYLSGVLDAGDATGSEQQLFPGAAQVDDVDSVRAALVHVRLHLEVHRGAADVGRRGQHLGDVVILQSKNV